MKVPFHLRPLFPLLCSEAFDGLILQVPPSLLSTSFLMSPAVGGVWIRLASPIVLNEGFNAFRPCDDAGPWKPHMNF